MKAMQKMIVAENSTIMSTSAYYFTSEGILRLESYAKPVTYSMSIFVVILVARLIEGQSIMPILAADAIILIVCIFMMLWVYPKETRLPKFSYNEIKQEGSLKRTKWSEISSMEIKGQNVIFHRGSIRYSGKLKGSKPEAARFFKSMLGRKFKQSK